MKHIFLTAFIAIFGVYALGLTGIIQMDTPAVQEQAQASIAGPQPLSFTERIAFNDSQRSKSPSKNGYTLKAMR